MELNSVTNRKLKQSKFTDFHFGANRSFKKLLYMKHNKA